MESPPHFLFPLDSSASLTLRVLGATIVIGVLVVAFGHVRRRRIITHAGIAILLLAPLTYGALYATRPAWQRTAFDNAAVATAMTPWSPVGIGVEVSQIDLSVDGAPVESIALVRLDPARHSFHVAHDAEAPRTVDEWRRQLAAIAVINGSYFVPDHSPQTPLRSAGRWLGPDEYHSDHGAFVADPSAGTASIVDLRGADLQRSIAPFPEAMVSYPLLVAPDGSSRAAGREDWLASRSFVGIDRRGWVVFGTTKHGYFSLRRLGAFLQRSPIDLTTALNLDGGPIASQAVHTDRFDRTIFGDAETNAGLDLVRARVQATRAPGVPLPIVLAALPR